MSHSEANSYGFRLIRSLLLTVLGGGSMIALGSLWFSLGTAGGSTSVLLIRVVALLLGVIVIVAGMAGLCYKIIADGVKRGIECSNTSD